MAIGPPLDSATGLHPGLTTVPLRGVEPSQVVLATRAGGVRAGTAGWSPLDQRRA
ncbi:hypothetical protein [Actinoplanes sp. NBRC 103695]|uniref:hypothetical protein n=1 Tax=Actinoplanes sp. NBRC 103695 TaxID=3032202 RepID=UPI0024A41097|nr:hypothetical protein [Actinoplanes sp. NBRC 103695]GLY99047.1 hypothetical protein Acsp02_63010 [Actinoplanes sp. NBRC 103695]